MSRPLWLSTLIKRAFPLSTSVARATRIPVIGTILDCWLFDGDEVIHLLGDRVVPVNETLDAPGDVVLPSQVVEHFIERANYRWIMKVCICREGNGCADYPIDLGCLFLGEAVLGINPRLGRLVTKEEALAHLQRCQEANLVHVIGRIKADSLWLGTRPGTKLLTVCNCCPCCCLLRTLPDLSPKISARFTPMPGVSVAVTDRCVGCGTCAQDVCFVDAIQMVPAAGDTPPGDGARASRHAIISDACRGCGRCVSVCPKGAIEISVDDSQFVEAAITRISRLVDVS